MLRRYESECNIKNCIQDDNFRNDTKRHFILIRLVCAIDDQNFSIQKRHFLTNDSCKEKFFQEFNERNMFHKSVFSNEKFLQKILRESQII
jgi:hypothetical protein